MGIKNYEISIAKLIAYGLYNLTSCLGEKKQQYLYDLFLRYDCDPFFGVSNVKWFLKSMEKNGQNFCLNGLNLRNINRITLYHDLCELFGSFAQETRTQQENMGEKLKNLENSLFEN